MKEEEKNKNIIRENEEKKQEEKEKKGGNAANIDAIISSPTENVRSRMSHETWSNTGTNISYEDQSAPGSQGSVGTGQGSGQDAVDPSIDTNSEYDYGRAEHPNEDKDENTEGKK